MAPSIYPLGDATQSTPSANASLVIPVIIIVSSAAGISSVLFVVILAIALHRRIRTQHLAKARTEAVPRLVITDTSMFPVSTVVVEDEAALDEVIASFKPLGAESLIMEGNITVNDVTVNSCRVHEEDERLLFPLPKISGPTAQTIPVFEQSCLANHNREDIKGDLNAICNRDDGLVCSLINLASCPNHVQTSEGVWWHDFHMEEDSLDSRSSMSDSESDNSAPESLCSINSKCDIPASLKFFEHSSAASVPDHGVETASETCQTSKVVSDDLAGDSEAKIEDTPYDKDILAYCWRLSDGGSGGNHGSISSLCDAKVIDHDISTTMIVPRSKAVTIQTYPTNETFDRRILEYCWKISENPSHKSVDHMPSSESLTVRFTTAARSVSGASVSGLADMMLHGSGHLVFPWDDGGGSQSRFENHVLVNEHTSQSGSEGRKLTQHGKSKTSALSSSGDYPT